MRVRCHQVLDAAYDAGIRYVDAARSYGLAESFLASWLARRELAPGEVTVGSKWGYTYVGEWRMDAETHEVKDHSLEALRRQWAESRELLGEHLDVYQIHSATIETGVLEDRDVLLELSRLAATGLTVGLSVSGPRQGEAVRRALEASVDGVNPFGEVQATWNLLEPSAGAALAEAHERGWGVVVKEAVANGRLAPGAGGAEEAALSAIADRHGSTVDAVAIAAALANPWVDVVLSGAVTPEQVAGNLGAIELALGPEDLASLGALAVEPGAYWSARSARAWT